MMIYECKKYEASSHIQKFLIRHAKCKLQYGKFDNFIHQIWKMTCATVQLGASWNPDQPWGKCGKICQLCGKKDLLLLCSSDNTQSGEVGRNKQITAIEILTPDIGLSLWRQIAPQTNARSRDSFSSFAISPNLRNVNELSCRCIFPKTRLSATSSPRNDLRRVLSIICPRFHLRLATCLKDYFARKTWSRQNFKLSKYF